MDQGYVHYLFVQIVWLLTMQHVQEVRANGVVVSVNVDTHAIMRETIPVTDNAWETGQHAVGDCILFAEVVFHFQVTQHRTTGTHNIHWMGIGRNTSSTSSRACGRLR